MHLYLAGVYTSNFNIGGSVYARVPEEERWMRHGIQHFLESYHYVHRQSYVQKMRDDGVRVFLDSGAFSAFTQGVDVDLPRYCDYIQQNADIILMASVLDAIGDPEGTYRNQMEMERRGVRPLPCFHYGEPEALLEHYIANYDYITLGGMVPISTPQLRMWLDRLFHRYICDENGVPKVKVHGFGLTSLPLMERYPWYSVDSSTWVQWAANGMILVPGVGQVNISANSSSRKIAGQHFDNISDIERAVLAAKIKGFGMDPERLRTDYVARWVWNLWAFPKWMEHKVFENERFIPESEGLF